MERLNSQTADLLHELIRMEKDGRDVSEYILDVLEGARGSSADYHCVEELADKRMIAADVEGGTVDADALMPAGRNYFKELADHDARARRAIWSDRRFQVGLSVITLVLSTLAGWVAGHI